MSNYELIHDSIQYAILHKHLVSTSSADLSSFLTSQRKGGCTHRSRVSAHERWWLYFWGIQVRESAPTSGGPPPQPIFTHKPLPCPQLTAQICSLWLSWSSALPPSFQPLQLINNWPRITNNRNRKRKCPSSELLPPWSTRFFVLGSGTSWMLLVLDSLMCVCLRWHCGIIWEAGFFRFKGVWKLTSNFK